jgi:hypothetical protein
VWRSYTATATSAAVASSSACSYRCIFFLFPFKKCIAPPPSHLEVVGRMYGRKKVKKKCSEDILRGNAIGDEVRADRILSYVFQGLLLLLRLLLRRHRRLVKVGLYFGKWTKKPNFGWSVYPCFSGSSFSGKGPRRGRRPLLRLPSFTSSQDTKGHTSFAIEPPQWTTTRRRITAFPPPSFFHLDCNLEDV